MAKKDFKKNTAELFISSAEDPPAPSDPKQVEQETGAAIPKGYKLVKENKSDRIHLLIRPTLKEDIKKEAAAQKVSVNDLINNVLEEYLERKGKNAKSGRH